MSSRFGLAGSFLLGLALTLVSATSAVAQQPRVSGVRVTVDSTPQGAQVFVDNTTSPALGVTPLRNVMVPRGQHTLIFRLEGYAEGRMAANVARARQVFQIQLTQLARINITAGNASAEGAQVYLDGSLLGALPVNQWIQPGRHQVRVQREGYQAFEQWIDLSPGQVLALPLQLERLAPRTGSISVAADVQGAPVFVDGQQRGTTPAVIDNVPEGDHVVEVRPSEPNTRPFSQSVRVTAGQSTLVNPQLRTAPATGSLRVVSATPGALISVDGEPVGASPAVRDNLDPGDHIVEVTANGYDRAQQTVTIESGRQRVLSINLQQSVQQANTGSLRVLCNTPGAVIAIDGETIGNSPAVRDGLTPGDHVVTVTAPGMRDYEQNASVDAGRQRVVSVSLEPLPRAPGRIVVNTDVSGATVFIDGEERGAPPVVIENAPAGTHGIVVRAPGYQEVRQTCTVGPGQNCEINAQMAAARVRVRVQVQTGVTGATFYLDGEERGPVPFEGEIPVGPHRIEVRARDYRPHVEQVQLTQQDDIRSFDIHLVGTNEMTPEERAAAEAARAEAINRAFSHTAAPLPTDLATFDVSGGWPYLAEVRLGIGLHRNVDAGFSVRSFGVLTDFEGRVRAGFHPIRQISVGGQFHIGGGVGPSRTYMGETQKTNSVFMSIEALMTLHFNRAAAVTLFGAFDLTSDRWNWSGENRDTFLMGAGRQTLGRVRIGGTLEFALSSSRNSLFLTVEGVPGQHDRRIFGDIFGIGGPTSHRLVDTHMYGRIGWTHKFSTR